MERERYLEQLHQLIDLGYTFELPEQFDEPWRNGGWFEESEGIEGIWKGLGTEEGDKTLGKSPSAAIAGDYEPNLYTHASLMRDRSIITNPLHIQIDDSMEERRYRLINMITGEVLEDIAFKKPAAFSAVVLRKRFQLALDRFFGDSWDATFDAKLRQVMAGYKNRRNYQRVFTRNGARGRNGTFVYQSSIEKWHELLKGFGGEFTVESVPARACTEIGLKEGTVKIRINPDLLSSRLALSRVEGPVHVNGWVRRIVIGTDVEGAAGIRLDAPKYDKYGNTILTGRDEAGRVVGIVVRRPPNLAEKRKYDYNHDYRGVDIDFEPDDSFSETLGAIITERVIYPLETTGREAEPYRLYSDYCREDLERIAPYLERIRRSAVEAERDLSITPGEAVKNIYFVYPNTEGEPTGSLFPETVLVGTDAIAALEEGMTDAVYHRSIQAIDAKYGISREGPFAEFAATHSFSFASLLTGIRDSEKPSFQQRLIDPFDGAKEAPLRVNPEQAPAFGPGSRRTDMPPRLRQLYIEACRAAAASIRLKFPNAAAADRLERVADSPPP